MQVTTLLKTEELVFGLSSDSLGYLYYCCGNAIWRVSLNNTTPMRIAGGNGRGMMDGEAKEAKLQPLGLCVDEKRGAIYFTEDHCVRVLKDGKVTTLAGNGGYGYADRRGEQARFRHPRGIAVNDEGTLFVCDSENHCIRVLDSAGNVSTLAGLPQQKGNRDGTGREARFDGPRGICFFKGMLWVCDALNNRVVSVTKSGVVSTVLEVSFGESKAAPWGICVDPETGLFFISYNHGVVSFDPSTGILNNLAGRADVRGMQDGIGETSFKTPTSLTFLQSAVFVSDRQCDNETNSLQ